MIYLSYNKRAYQIFRTLTKTSPISTSIIVDNNEKPLSDKTKILNLWTKYCNDLYIHLKNPGTNILINTDIFKEATDTELSILDTEVMYAINDIDAINMLKEGK